MSSNITHLFPDEVIVEVYQPLGILEAEAVMGCNQVLDYSIDPVQIVGISYPSWRNGIMNVCFSI